jgi:hypothetical protein
MSPLGLPRVCAVGHPCETGLATPRPSPRRQVAGVGTVGPPRCDCLPNASVGHSGACQLRRVSASCRHVDAARLGVGKAADEELAARHSLVRFTTKG